MKTSTYIAIVFLVFFLGTITALHVDSKLYEDEYIAARKIRLQEQTELQTFAKLYYLSSTDDNSERRWNHFIEGAKAYYKKGKIDPMFINNWTWHIAENYKYYNDTLALALAEKWCKKAYEMEPKNHFINDTYASILFEMGRVEEALPLQKYAVEKVTEEKHEYEKWYKFRLKQYKKAIEDKKQLESDLNN